MLHSIGIIAVAAIVTLFIRAIPFVLFGGKREVPATVTYLGKVLPPAIMVILVPFLTVFITGKHEGAKGIGDYKEILFITLMSGLSF